ncbi:hypothetical protein [Cohnella hongkongensis]|uniref:Uncharacterized protein n=1 Tax=Cohnella hongkongensis TaxID=178337 RepID=A0ABV9FAV6_9BACL
MLTRQFVSWAALALTGFFVVLLLGRLPLVEQSLSHRHPSVSVFETEEERWLTDDRLVDALSAIRMSNRPIRVGWDHAILAVDLRADRTDELRQDIRLLIDYAFMDVRNVKQVLVRVFEWRGERKTLLLAAETRRSDWTDEELAMLKLSAEGIGDGEIEPSSNIRWTMTPEGRRRLINFANS